MIKKWFQFITEAYANHPPETKSMYPLDEDDISDYLLDMTESGHWLVTVNFGFLTDDDRYIEKITSHTVRPSIGIQICSCSKTTNTDFTSTVTSFIKRVSHLCKEIKIHDDDSEVNIVELKFQGGVFISDNPEGYDPMELDNGIWINLSFESFTMSDRDIFEYYGIEPRIIKSKDSTFEDISFTDNGSAKILVEVDDLINWCVSRGDSYAKFITDPDTIWDWYIGTFDYEPDHNSFFDYHLDSENLELLLRICIKLDGWDEVKDNITSYISRYSESEDIDQEEFIKTSVSKSGDYKELGNMIENLPKASEVYRDLRRDYVNYEENAKADDDLEKIIEAFDKIVEENLISSIIKKEKYTFVTRKENKQKHEFYDCDVEREYYQISFNIDWMSDMDSDDIFGSTIHNIISNFADGIYPSEINPYFHDYADVDEKSYNADMKHNLMYHLNKTT